MNHIKTITKFYNSLKRIILRIPLKTKMRISEDFRKAGGGLAGIGLAGIIIQNDGITITSGEALFFIGSLLWIFSILLAYQVDKRETK